MMGIYNYDIQKLGFKTVANCRDLGGYVLPDGRKIKKGLLLRGGALNKISDDELVVLRDEYHLAKIFDFRTSMELQVAPDREIEGAKYFWLPAFDEEKQKMERSSLPQEAFLDFHNWLASNAWRPEVQNAARILYTDMIVKDFTQVQYAGFLQNIVKTDQGAVYWHCSQGKDRTGMGAALLLAALGADRKLIMEDYYLSSAYYREELESVIDKVGTQEEKAVIRTFISVNPDYFEAALDLIEEKYGSMQLFLRNQLSLSDSDIQILKDRYLE